MEQAKIIDMFDMYQGFNAMLTRGVSDLKV